MTLRLPALRSGLLSLCLFASILLSAQSATPSPAYKALASNPEVDELQFNEQLGTPRLIRIGATQKASLGATAAPELLTEFFHLDKTKEARFDRSTRDGSGFQVDRYQEFYKGVKVEHGRYMAVANDEGLKLITSEHYDVPTGVRTTPTLSLDAALVKATEFVGAEQYAWEYIADNYVRGMWSPEFAQHVQDELDAVQPGGELVLIDDYGTEATDLDLAYKFNIYAAAPLSRAWIYVNAHTGKVMLKDAIIKHASQPVSVETRYAGTRDIMVDLQTTLTDPHSGLPLLDSRNNAPATSPLYVLRDDTRGDGLETYDLNGQGGIPLSLPALYAQGKAFTDDDLNWTLAEHKRGGTVNEAENDDTAWDAHWGTMMVYDYWLDVHGRRSYDDNDIAIKSFLHYGVAYDNAFWNGTAMTYGDGSYQGGANPNGSFAPLMSLDVCGHEVGHAICSHTSDLVYAKESGAMNEGFSDIWGAAIEAYVFRKVDPALEGIMAPWGIGEQIDEGDGGIQYPEEGWEALRYMDTPNKASDPDTYGGAFWKNPDCDPSLANDQCGVHSNSGVLNKWFFVLTQGETATNDNGDDYSVNGLGFEVAERIAYGTELLLTPNATFAEARAASIAFVQSMNEEGGGNCGNLQQQVTNAWFAVGVGEAFNCEVVAGFTTKRSTINETVIGGSGCEPTKIITVEATVFNRGRVNFGGTARKGIDYRVLNDFYNVGPRNFGVHNFEIEIIDDVERENDETIILTLQNRHTHIITLTDDDINLPVGDETVTLIDQTMRSANLPAGWKESTLLSGPNAWFGNAQNGAQVGIIATGGLAPVYNGNGAGDLILSSPLIDARGMRDLKLDFDYKVGGETDVPTGLNGAPELDYGNLAYSFDGETWTDFPNYESFVSLVATVATGSFDETLPSNLWGATFYLGWRFRHDALVNGVYSFSFENVVLTGRYPGIASERTVSEVKPNRLGTTYFTNDDGTEMVAKFTDVTGFNYGCTTFEVLTEGTGKNRCAGGVFMDKTWRMSPSAYRNGLTSEITFYLTDAEVAGFENATGEVLEDLMVYRTPNFVCSSSSDDRIPARYTFIEVIEGGYAVTAGFKSGGNFFSIGFEDDFIFNFREGVGSEAEQITADGGELGVLPNPFNGQLTIQVAASATDSPTDIRLLNLTGQLLREQQVTGPRTTFNVGDLPAGTYLVEVTDGAGIRRTSRVVKR